MNGIGHHRIPSPTFNGYDVSSVNQKNVIATRYRISKSTITSDPEKFSGSLQLSVEFGYLSMLSVLKITHFFSTQAC